MKHADFKTRFLAGLLDLFICLLFYAILYFSIVSQQNLEQAFASAILALIISLNPVFLLYSIIMTYYFGGTLGKLLTGLQIVAEDYKKLSFKRIFFRQTIGYSFSWIFFGLGFYAIAKDPQKQAWHDKTVGSLVVQKNNLTLTGAIVSVVVLAATIYIFTMGTQIFLQGPLSREIKILITPKPTPSFTPPRILR